MTDCPVCGTEHRVTILGAPSYAVALCETCAATYEPVMGAMLDAAVRGESIDLEEGTSADGRLRVAYILKPGTTAVAQPWHDGTPRDSCPVRSFEHYAETRERLITQYERAQLGTDEESRP